MADLRRRDNSRGWRGVRDVQTHTEAGAVNWLAVNNIIKEENKERAWREGRKRKKVQNQQGWREDVIVWP